MIKRLLPISLIFGLLAACGAPNGVLVSQEAVPLGGNLFLESSSSGGKLLVLDGEITPATAKAFERIVETSDPPSLVIAQSPGGHLIASHQIGRTLSAERMNTVVLVSCISACVDVFIAGQRREMTEVAELGLHAATNRDISYELDRRYWREFGFSEVNEAAYKVSNRDIWIVDAKRARELRMATAIIPIDG